MTQDPNEEKHYIASEGKVFQRVFDGFKSIKKPVVLGNELILGLIVVNGEGKPLRDPIEDKIEYYEEIDKPVEKEKESDTESTDLETED